jgi:response regulator RpfG family c-di-GMP phosphodiesterase
MIDDMCAVEVRVLYVDDEVSLCRAFARMFGAEEDFRVDTTTSPLEAASLIEEHAFDVIVSDLRMPGMDGIELLTAARHKRPHARRLLVSGFADLDTALSAINKVGVDRLLTKPCDSIELLQAVRTAGDNARLARENTIITEELHRKAEELSAMNRALDRLVEERTNDLLRALVSALDLRDSETQWHSRRVGRYARRLAQEMGLGGRDLDDIERGAMLHDVGKIGVRDAVLLKPGPLDESEWTEMRRHPALGHEILHGISFLDEARLIPLHHQERWDGSGYPTGLKGEEICLGARIFAVVDTFDAITSDRPYRKASTYVAAREEIVRCAGTQLDPRVVDVFLSISPTVWADIRRDLESAI